MNDLKEVKEDLEVIKTTQRLLLELLARPLDDNYPDGEHRFISSKQIKEDLNISQSTFIKHIVHKMPFLFRLTNNGDYRCRLIDYRKWKKQTFHLD